MTSLGITKQRSWYFYLGRAYGYSLMQLGCCLLPRIAWLRCCPTYLSASNSYSKGGSMEQVRCAEEVYCSKIWRVVFRMTLARMIASGRAASAQAREAGGAAAYCAPELRPASDGLVPGATHCTAGLNRPKGRHFTVFRRPTRLTNPALRAWPEADNRISTFRSPFDRINSSRCNPQRNDHPAPLKVR